MLKILHPDKFYSSIFDIAGDDLKKRGVRGLIVDLDNTLIPRREKKVSAQIITWVENMKSEGLGLVIVSNNLTRRVRQIASKVDLPLIAPAGKPSRRPFKKGMKVLGTTAPETAVIGDQLFTDIIGGKRMNLFTILVSPVGNDEMFHTRLLRRLEKLILNRANITNNLK